MTGAREAVTDAVRRWEASGGHWRVLSRSDTSVVLGLFSCDGGEEMHRLTAAGAEIDSFLAGRTRSDE
jgi:hypothetical protein